MKVITLFFTKCLFLAAMLTMTQTARAQGSVVDWATQSTGAAVQALNLGFGPGKYPLQFVGHTFWKDGCWNTLCVPFDMSDEELRTAIATESHPFYGAEFRELDVEGKYNDEGQPDDNGKHITGKDYSTATAYLFFKPAKEIVAGSPYLVKWSSGNNLDNPIINATIGSCRNAVTVRSEDQTVLFIGAFTLTSIDLERTGYLFLGGNNNLYAPSTSNYNQYPKYIH